MKEEKPIDSESRFNREKREDRVLTRGCIASTGLYIKKLQVVTDKNDVKLLSKLNAKTSISNLKDRATAMFPSLTGAPALAYTA